MIHSTISIGHAIKVLNRALESDPVAIQVLIDARVPCNDKLRMDPTVQVSKDSMVGLLGIINGLFGADFDGYGTIAAKYESGKLVEFYDLERR